MIKIILADSELQLVPKYMWNHPSVRKNADRKHKKPGDILLDASLHHSAMRGKNEKNRMGRPDIVHAFLLLALDSIALKEYDVELYIHTRENKIITVSNNLRIPKNYNRFCGLMEKLLKDGKIQSEEGDVLMDVSDGDLKYLVEKIRGPLKKVVVLEPNGEKRRLNQVYSDYENIIFVVGGFPNGTYISDISKLSDEIISIHDEELTVWSVIAEILVHYELSEKGLI